MEVKFKKYFLTQFDRLKSVVLKEEILTTIDLIKIAGTESDLPDYKRMAGFKNYGRVRVNNYRIGVEIQNHSILIMCIYHRSIVYSHFPKPRKK